MLELAPEIDITCDVQQFENGNIGAYHGEFLEDFSIPQADVFETWANGQRTHLRTQYLKQIFIAGSDAFSTGNYTLAERYCEDYLRADPIEESVVAMLMQTYQLQKKYRRAIELYDELLPNAGVISSYLPAAQSDVYNQTSDFYGGQAVYKDIVEFAGKVPAINYGAYYNDIRSALTDAITNVVQNGADIDEEIQNAQDAVEFNISE